MNVIRSYSYDILMQVPITACPVLGAILINGWAILLAPCHETFILVKFLKIVCFDF